MYCLGVKTVPVEVEVSPVLGGGGPAAGRLLRLALGGGDAVSPQQLRRAEAEL